MLCTSAMSQGATSSADTGCPFKVVTGARTASHDGELYHEDQEAIERPSVQKLSITDC